MEANVVHDGVEIEEEYVLLDLDSVPGQFDISPDAPYVLSGLDTLDLILVIDNKLKLITEKKGRTYVFIAVFSNQGRTGRLSQLVVLVKPGVYLLQPFDVVHQLPATGLT